MEDTDDGNRYMDNGKNKKTQETQNAYWLGEKARFLLMIVN